jgi:Bacteriophage tail sheath protein
MPVSPTYPGVYIEELPSSAHTITGAPTSITVFVGYTHPFKTNDQNFNKAIRVFNFTEYEREFGGLFRHPAFDSSLPYAVQQFFLNGGSVAYIVALRPTIHVLPSTDPQPADPVFPRATATIGNVTFESLEASSDSYPMEVTVSNLQSANTEADIAVSFGGRAEIFRRVKLAELATRLESSDLMRLASIDPASDPTVYTLPSSTTSGVATFMADVDIPDGVVFTTFSAQDFIDVFAAESALDNVDIFNLLAIPGQSDFAIWSEAATFCERKQAFLIMDAPANATSTGMGGQPPMDEQMVSSSIVPKSKNAALYFPYLTAKDQVTGETMAFPPSGFVAGIFARTDNDRGVWKAPAGLETIIRGATGVVEDGRLTDMRAGVLNEVGVNCLRTFGGVGTVVYGARTTVAANVAFEQWKYVPVRRTALFIEQTLSRNLKWVVFEPNDEPLWVAIRTSIEGFMMALFRQGAFQGATPSQAFQVKCDASTTTQTDIDNGVVNIIVGFRPLKPAEFVIIKIAQLAGQVQA